MPKKNEKQRLHNYLFFFFFGGGGGGEIRSIRGNVKVAYSCFIIHLIYRLVPLSTHPIVFQPSNKTPIIENFLSFIEVNQ